MVSFLKKDFIKFLKVYLIEVFKDSKYLFKLLRKFVTEVIFGLIIGAVIAIVMCGLILIIEKVLSFLFINHPFIPILIFKLILLGILIYFPILYIITKYKKVKYDIYPIYKDDE